MKKKLFVWFLAAALLCALFPASALAATACTFAFTTDALADGAVGFPYSATAPHLLQGRPGAPATGYSAGIVH